MNRIVGVSSRKNRIVTTFIAVGLALAAFQVPAAQPESGGVNDYQGELRDAWIDGRLEAAYLLNRVLNPYEIRTDVEQGQVTLDGTVDSLAKKELAAELARGVEGVSGVTNTLSVTEGLELSSEFAKARKDFLTAVDEATLVAAVKSELMLSDALSALAIDVDAAGRTISLRGEVETRAERKLAKRLALNVDGVTRVKNDLDLAGSS